MAIRARIFYYSQRIGVEIDFDTYKSWLAAHPEHEPPDILPEPYRREASHAAEALPWQRSAPKMQLYVDKKKEAAVVPAQGAGKDAPYPSSFGHIVELISKGTPVPGVRDIPNTVVRDPTVAPFGKMARPRKPWELARDGRHFPSSSGETSQSDGGGFKANETFPPLQPGEEDEEKLGSARNSGRFGSEEREVDMHR